MLKVVTVVGTRPELIRLSRIIPKLDQFFDHSLIHTGQNFDYELNDVFFKDLDIRAPDVYLNSAGRNAAESIANIIRDVDDALEKLNPDIFLILGDTNSCMSAIAAKKRKIPIFHLEAGNRCFDQRVPEEVNRKIIDHISDVNLTYSSIAREHLLNEGLNADRVIKVGSPLDEVISFYREKIDRSTILDQLMLTKEKFFVFSAHREENIDIDFNFKRLCEVLRFLSKEYKIPVIVSTHPRTLSKIKEENISFDENIRLLKPLSFSDYVQLMVSSKSVLSDSGSISEESSLLNFPAINIRETQERHEALEEAAVIFTGLNLNRIKDALEICSTQLKGKQRNINVVSDYAVDNVSEKVVRLIVSYKDYVDRVVWSK